jgi:hypothetical protein
MSLHFSAQQFRAKVPEGLCPFVAAYRYGFASLEISVSIRLRPQTRAPHNQHKTTHILPDYIMLIVRHYFANIR